MKSLLFVLAFGWCVCVTAQTKTKTPVKTSKASTKAPAKPAATKKCPPLVVDLTTGTVNGLSPETSMEKIMAKLPCFTGTTEEGSDFNCGGGVFYITSDIFFYTQLDAVEIRAKYNGKFKKDGKEVILLGINADDLQALMGGTELDTKTDEDNFVNIYGLKNGSIRVKVEDGKVSEVSLHTQAPSEIETCV